MKESTYTLILSNLTRGQEAKLRRLALGWRQIDLASKAGVSTIEVACLEKDRYVLPTRANKMLFLLGMRLVLLGTITSELGFCEYPDEYDKRLGRAKEKLNDYIRELEKEFGMKYDGMTEITKEDIKVAIDGKWQ